MSIFVWPNPAKPGYPPNPDKSEFYIIVSDNGESSLVFWNSKTERYEWPQIDMTLSPANADLYKWSLRAIVPTGQDVVAMAKVHDERVTELLQANNREVARRREAEAELRQIKTVLESCGLALEANTNIALQLVKRYKNLLAERNTLRTERDGARADADEADQERQDSLAAMLKAMEQRDAAQAENAALRAERNQWIANSRENKLIAEATMRERDAAQAEARRVRDVVEAATALCEACRELPEDVREKVGSLGGEIAPHAELLRLSKAIAALAAGGAA